MAKTKTVKFKSLAEGPIRVFIGGPGTIIDFEPGETRTYETDDPREIEALRLNPDTEEVKNKKGDR